MQKIHSSDFRPDVWCQPHSETQAHTTNEKQALVKLRPLVCMRLSRQRRTFRTFRSFQVGFSTSWYLGIVR
uniref:Uncharacterized protein n=1 Tax=Daphnia galeata TaxID=27404 RepID=A0A8J2RQP6_9CRUS|nr:unnamed protein product [Daphnia galeata]